MYCFKKTLSVCIAYIMCGHAYEKILEEEEFTKILKILGLINNIEKYQKIYNHV